MTDPLKLLAHSADDLTILSSLLQDCALRVGDMAWRPAEHRFALMGNRFRWEKKRRFFAPKGERVRAALVLDGILAAELRGLDLKAEDEVLALLSITAEPAADDAFTLILAFAGGASVRLSAECIDASLSDLGDGWEALARPQHKA